MRKCSDSTDTKPPGAVWLCAGHPVLFVTEGQPKCCSSQGHPDPHSAVSESGFASPLPECCYLGTPAALGGDGCPGGFQLLHHTTALGWDIPQAPTPSWAHGSSCPMACTSPGKFSSASAPATSFFLSLPPFIILKKY